MTRNTLLGSGSLALHLFLQSPAAGDQACLTGQKFGVRAESRRISAASASVLGAEALTGVTLFAADLCCVLRAWPGWLELC